MRRPARWLRAPRVRTEIAGVVGLAAGAALGQAFPLLACG